MDRVSDTEIERGEDESMLVKEKAKPEKLFQCENEGCKSGFTLKHNMKRHMKECRPETRKSETAENLVCSREWCTKVFTTKYNLNRHLEECKPPKQNESQCFICKKVFSKPANLRRHLSIHSKPSSGKKLKKESEKEIKESEKEIKETKKDKKLPSSNPKCNQNDYQLATSMIDFNIVPNEDCEVKSMLCCDSENDCYFPSMAHTSNEYGGNDAEVPCSSKYFRHNEFQYEYQADPTHDAELPFTCVQSYPADSSLFIVNEDVEQVNTSDNEYVEQVNKSENEDVEPDCEANVYIIGHDVPLPIDEFNVTAADTTIDELERMNRTFSRATRKYLRKELRNSRHRMNRKISTAKMIKRMFGKELEDPEFFSWLSTELLLPKPESLKDILKYADAKSPFAGRKTKLTTELATKVYNFWKDKSIISVDRRNDRHYVKLSPTKIHHLLRDIEDENVLAFTTTKGKSKLKGHRHIYTQSIKSLYQEFIMQEGEEISQTSFYILRPFYIVPPSTREMETCTCINCVNPHFLYNSLKKNVKNLTGKVLPESLTAFLTAKFQCNKDSEIDYWDIECIRGNCKNKCKIELEKLPGVDDKLYSYVKFKQTVTTYYNTEGKQVEYTRCARNVESASLHEMLAILQNEGANYLKHRYAVSLDKVFWPRFRAECKVPIVNIDYSENIKLTPKNEVQSAHFSGRQHTLHCCVFYRSNKPKDHEFVYHLSDDTTHDAIMTFTIIEDLLTKYPSIIDNGILVIRSDNCSTQYKSRYTFAQMKELAQKYEIDIFWFYGAAGHGRGLVDAMSSFGAKGPLRKAIITDNLFFNNAFEMKNYLSQYFAEDDTKSYFQVEEQTTAEKRNVKKQLRPQIPIPGSSNLHLIAVSSKGHWLTKSFVRVSDEEVMNLNIESDDIDEDVEIDGINEEEPHEDNPHTILDNTKFNDIKFDFISNGSFVALFSPASGFEPFYLVQVLEKGIAETRMEDEYEHIIPTGHLYIKASYYEKEKEKRNCVEYKKSKVSNVFINMNEIASVNVEFDGLQMSKEEYVSICRDVLA